MKLVLEVRPEAWDGLLLYAAELPDLQGDFVAVSIRNGYVEFR